ncbi:MAG: hypothetical protein GF398_10755 [Chitinivibrionales bacterium]|nr:hypothetical protein [Chitinivibrionales bacterium]
MDFKTKDIMSIAAVVFLSFWVMFFVFLLATGRARVEFGPRLDTEGKEELKTFKIREIRDSLVAAHSKTYQALVQKEKELDEKNEKLAEKLKHIEMMETELKDTKTELAQEREHLEKLVAESSELDKKRIRQLAKVYGAMRAEEAARILETLPDDLVINIITSINDDRQKAKIVAAISQAKASRISRKIGKPVSQL